MRIPGLSSTAPYWRPAPLFFPPAALPVVEPAPPALASGDRRRFFVEHPGLAYGDPSRGVPGFGLLDGFLSRTRIEQARQALAARPVSLERLLSGLQTSFSRSLREAIDRVVRHVGGLRSAASALLVEETYRQGRAGTSDGADLTVKATATNGAGSAATSLKVLSLARSQETASDPRADAGAALGLRGRFLLGGVAIPVLATDDLFALADRITYGEDANRNGRLDGIEDRNANLRLDPLEDRNADGRLDTEEDLNGNAALDAGEDLNFNGRLDRSEDLNHNFQLDGGTVEHGVEARVLEGRLVLRHAVAGPESIQVSDPDAILGALGFLSTDYQGDLVFSHLVAAAAGARVEKDGGALSLDGNVSSDLIEGVTLELRREGGPLTVRVDRDFSRAVSSVRLFVREFNGVVGELNGLLDDGGVLAREPRAQRFRRGLERATQDPLAEPSARSLDAGLAPVAVRDESFSELQILGALDRLRAGLQGVFDEAHGLSAAAGHLSQLGIATLEDDTLSLDEGTLSSALARDPSGVRRLLSGPGGIAGRVGGALDAAADPGVGSLPRFQASQEGLRLTPLAKGARDFQKAQRLGDVSQLIAVA